MTPGLRTAPMCAYQSCSPPPPQCEFVGPDTMPGCGGPVVPNHCAPWLQFCSVPQCLRH